MSCWVPDGSPPPGVRKGHGVPGMAPFGSVTLPLSCYGLRKGGRRARRQRVKALCDRRCCDEGPGRLLTLSTWSVFLGSGKTFASTSGPTLTLVCQDGPGYSLQLEGDLRGPFPKGRHPAHHFSWRLLSWVMGGPCLPPLILWIPF